MKDILSLVRLWQNKGRWQATFELGSDWKKQRANVNRNFGLRDFQIQKENADILHKALLASESELGQVVDYLRANAPLLLHMIPIVDFLADAPTDYKPLITSMLKIEGELLAMREALKGAAASPDDEGSSLGRLMAAADDNMARIVTIADMTGMRADDKLRAISAIDSRFYGKTSGDLATLLKVTDSAIRDTQWWKVDRKKYRWDDEEARR